ncbi:MAG: cation:proton antiporter [Gemmatimonadetes bacterium]|nr:cation:proton antiporter [Gemmatimonadota bacterium]
MDESGSYVIGIVGSTMGLLLVATGVMAVSRRIRIPFAAAGITVPFTVGLVVTGIVLAQIGRFGGEAFAPIANLRISSDVVFFVLLPTLIFEAAFKLDARTLRENLAGVLLLAVPGLILSTGLIAGMLVLATPLGWFEALLLGSILSATEHMGITSLLRRLGAPKRLTILVEGESLFNDATAIVLARILTGILLAGVVANGSVVFQGGLEFFVVFFGGMLLGWACAVLVGMILGRVDGDAFIEVTLTTVLAYVSFLVAEVVLGVSGVMATVVAGVLIGGWGKAKISPSIADYLERFWGYMSMVANALIFLMVGLAVDLGALADSLPLLLVVIVAMLASRAVVVFGLVPGIGRLPEYDPIGRGHQTVMFWGGLRGALALAVALSLPDFGREVAGFGDLNQVIVALVMGAVLFSLLVQGLTIEALVRKFKLHVPPLSDRLARLEGLLSAKQRTLERIPELETGGLFSPVISEQLRTKCEAEIKATKSELEELRGERLDSEQARRLLYLRLFGEENVLYYQMFSRGHLTERAYRSLVHSIDLQTEGIRHQGRLPEYTLYPPTGERLESTLYRIVDRVPGWGRWAERLRAQRTARDYEIAWARSQVCFQVTHELEDLVQVESTPPEVLDELRSTYGYWHEQARIRIDQSAEQFPEFVSSAQERLAKRMVLQAEREAIEEKARAGLIPEGVTEAMLEDLAAELRGVRASQPEKLTVGAEELLKNVPFFTDMPESEFSIVAAKLRRRTVPAGEIIVRQGGSGSSLFLVARGVIRVSRQDGGVSRDLATLIAGEFFGEMALLHGTPRTATCRAMTPCALYELRRNDIDVVREVCPEIQRALEEADRRRRAEHRMSSPEKTFQAKT